MPPAELPPDELLTIRFKSASVVYFEDYTIEVRGRLWPRQMRAANELIEIYKRCSREDNQQTKGES